MVLESCGVLRHPMGKLVARNIDVVCQILEDNVVSVAEDHPGAVPEGVIEACAVVYIRIQVYAKVVDRIPSQDITIELERGSQCVVGEIRVLLGNRRIALVPYVDKVEVN